MNWLKTLLAISLIIATASAAVTLEYSTYLGGTGSERIRDIAVDSSSNVYVTGLAGDGFPVTAGAFDETFNGGTGDPFVAKFNSTGNGLIYATYLGGTGFDEAFGIAVDSSGNAYVTGYATTGFPTVAGSFDTSHGGGNDVFVTKINSTGNGLIYSTFLGAAGTDAGAKIVIDGSGNAYVTGDAGTGFPTTAGAFDTSVGGSTDAFITKLNPTGTGLVYSTFIGGANFDQGKDIAIDSSGNAYITGQAGTGFPTTAGAFNQTHGGSSEAFIAKLNSTGNGLTYSTFLGGSAADTVTGIAVDSSGNAYLTGYTQSTGFPTTSGAYQESFGGFIDIFVTKLNAAGSALVYSTYIGGLDDETGQDIDIDSSGVAYIIARVDTLFPTTSGAYNETQNGNLPNAGLVKLSANGSTLEYSTYFGGASTDFPFTIDIDDLGNVYFAGFTQSGDFPTLNAYQGSIGGGNDAFLAKFAGLALVPLDFSWSCDDTNLFIVNSTGGSASSICTVTNNEASPLSMSFTNTTMSLGSVSISPTSATVSASGTQAVNYTVTVAAGSAASTTFDAEATANSSTANTVTITVERNDTEVIALSANTATTCLGDTFRLTADSSISAFTCKDCSTDCSASCDADFTSLNPSFVTTRNATEQNITCGVVDDGVDTFAGEICVTVDSSSVASGKESLLELVVFCSGGWTTLDTTATAVNSDFRVCGDIGAAESCTALASGFIVVGTDAPVFTTGPTTTTTNVTATINWSTDETANYTITVSGLGVTNSTSGFATTYAVNITGLTPSTSYTFNVSACNTENCSLAQGFSFTTSASANISDPNSDVDGDGISDADEITLYGTNPYVADTDSDGFTDFEEVELGSDPVDASSVPSAAYSSIQVAPAFGIIGLAFLLLGAIILSFITQPRSIK